MVILATGASQFEFIAALKQEPVSWRHVTVFHLDEFLGMPETHPASFRRYLKERILDDVKPATIHFIEGDAPDIDAVITQYEALLLEDEIDVACVGIGENGHIAFNDPGVADFNDPRWVRIVELDQECRRQQIGEGWFRDINDVPSHAVTLTVPAMMRCKMISCAVPDERKAKALKNALTGPISEACPASVLRKHPQTILWLDRNSASLL